VTGARPLRRSSARRLLQLSAYADYACARGGHLLRGLSVASNDYARYLAMRIVLTRVARRGTLEEGLRVADRIARWLVVGSNEGRCVRSELGAIFGLASREAHALACGVFARPLRDFVFLRRIVARREPFEPDAVVHTGSDEGRRLAAGDAPSIIVTGHFARRAAMALYAEATIPGPLNVISDPLVPRSALPYPLRNRLQLSTLFGAVHAWRGPGTRFLLVDPRGEIGWQLARQLVIGRQKVTVAGDAPWRPGRTSAHLRPFAGRAEFAFSMGPAILARLAQVPLVFCLPYIRDDGRTVLDWSDPFPPPPRRSTSTDVEVTDAILDRIELAVGLRPAQYVLAIADERRWDRASRCWRPR
jgi:lauroyl/myristoyl acyltransferase